MSPKNTNDNDKSLFQSFVSGITPLKTHTVAPHSIKPKAKVKKKAIIAEISNPHNKASFFEADAYFAFHLNKKKRKQLKAGNIAYDVILDLHGLTIAQSEQRLSQFINDCRQQNIQCALIIYGQGHHSPHGSVLKPAVLYWLSRQTCIDAYCPAQKRDGGQGASYILFQKQTI